MTQRTVSLRKQLLVWISIPVLAAGIITALSAFSFSWFEIAEVYDAQLVHSAKVLLQFTEHEILENGTIQLGTENPHLQHRYEKKMAFRIWLNDQLVTQSARSESFGEFQAPPGFSDQRFNGKPWRFFVFIDPSTGLRVETSERYAIRYEMIGQLMISLLAPALIFIPAIMLIIWIGVRKSLNPLIMISGAVDRRQPDDLTPIAADTVPAEARPLVLALNRLFVRTSQSFQREREFTDNAAHELRTPLAAMKIQTQVLMKKASQMPECREGLDNLNAIINRATRLIDQLLSFARLQNETPPMADMDLSECVHNVVAEFSPLSMSKKQDFKACISENVRISGHYESLSIMARNLLDNAIKYTPQGGAICVSLSQEGTLTISDTGPGLPVKDRERAFERFVRMDRTGETGSGLGLSIAKWVADAHHVAIKIKNNEPHGLVMTVEWNVLPARD